MDEMSSERFRERLFSGDEPTSARSHLAPGPTAHTGVAPLPPLQNLRTNAPLPRSEGWKPQNWRLRTKLIALVATPMLLATTLGMLKIVDSAKHSHSAAIRDTVIIGAVLLLSLIALLIVSQSILKPLRVLRASAFDVADRRLPGVIEQLRTTEGRSQDIRIEPVPVHSREDVGQVARAFDAVHSEAVRLAAEQAALRANVNDMFVNLSRRSQGLVERQLRLIDDLELGELDSDRLAALFRLDHLATRMRRNGENLLVLAGAELRQRSGEPVPIVDVLRAAVSEIEEYRRVTMPPLPRAMVSGLAVNDVVHVVAELLDNATAYSGSGSQVRLSASFVDEGGLAVEISDAGVGLPRARLADINQRLAAPPAIDVAVSRQMGLFVVGRLANRHEIRVRLASPDNFGVTVTVTLPKELVTAETAGVGGRSNYLGRSSSQPTRAGTVDGTPDDDRFHWPGALSLDGQAQVGDAAPAHPGLLDDPTAVSGNPADTPIFEAMLSRWFTEGQGRSAPPEEVTHSAAQETIADEGWGSEADAGWQAAQAASEPTADEVTAAGLPKRRPQAFLVPGRAGPSTMSNGQLGSPATRNAYALRGRLSSFQRGLDEGRHAGPVKTAQDVGGDLGEEHTVEGKHTQRKATSDSPTSP